MSTGGTAAIVEHVSTVPFDTTLERLIGAIARAGLILFSQIDHQAGAREAGLEMPHATVLTYRHPRGGTPAMIALPLAALDLPLRVLVRVRDDGRTEIAFHPIEAMLRRAGVPHLLATRLYPARQLLADAVTL